MSLLFCILFIFMGIYAILLLVMALGFLRTKPFKTTEKYLQLPLTLIICARNEEKNIARCLRSIIQQEYLAGKIQLLLINDASTDSTVQQAEALLKTSDINYRIISNPQQKGKKQSISYAMQFAANSLVVLRDADTFTNSKKWLQSISDFYQTTGADLIIGPLGIANNFGLLWALQAIENNVLALLACGSAFYKNSFLCSGANLIFTKSVFEKVNGYASHLKQLSGDDIFFMEDVKKLPGATIAYLKSEDAVVYTYPCYSFPDLINQKIRWASKFKFNKNMLNLGLAVLSFIINAGWLYCFIYIYLNPLNSKPALIFILLKLIIDILLLFLSSRFIKNKSLGWFALPVGCIYPLYACMVALASAFVKPKWKL